MQASWLDEKSQAAIILTVIGSGLFAYLGILVGTNAAKEFGGSPALGALAGILIINPAAADIMLFGTNILPGRGGLIGVLLAAILWHLLRPGSDASSRNHSISSSHQPSHYSLQAFSRTLSSCQSADLYLMPSPLDLLIY